jgi:hypothetical protein
MDITSYDKAAKHNLSYGGYEARKSAPTAIVVHSTSNPHQKNTAFAAEATFLLDATLASAHYLIGKDGAVVRFLDPRQWAAWHAGNAQPAYLNQHSIGIELHHSVGDPPYPTAQLDALAGLLRSLMGLFDIPAERIETHGQIAIAGPYIRKTDPSDWPYASFLFFRSQLGAFAPTMPDPFEQWGAIGHPTGEAMNFAIPRAWLMNKVLGACVVPERTSESQRYAVAEFEHGIVVYFKARNSTEVVLF